jgi:hypothetical protein
MCGIAGIVNRGDAAQGADTQALARMAARMRPRGPDGEGEWRSPDGRAALAHQRLAIIDLSPAGAQPMVDPATGNVIVFNGAASTDAGIALTLGKARLGDTNASFFGSYTTKQSALLYEQENIPLAEHLIYSGVNFSLTSLGGKTGTGDVQIELGCCPL